MATPHQLSRPTLVTWCLVAIVATTTLSCAAAADDRRDSPLLRHDAIVDLALQLDDEAIASLSSTDEHEVRGRLTTGGRQNDERETVDVTVRIKGGLGSKRAFTDKPALKIKTANDARVLGLERLTLNNMVQDPTMLHEALGYQVYADAGVQVPRTGYVRLTINGEPYGLYLQVETIDRAFLRERFGSDKGLLYEGEQGADLRERHVEKFDLEEGDDSGRATLKKLVAAVAAPGDGVFYGDTALVDTPSFVSMMAVQALIADTDNYYKSNNYRIYWHPSRHRWFFIPTGLDQTFADDRQTVFGGTGMLFQKCLTSVRCTADYAAAVRQAADRFERLDLGSTMNRLLALIDRAAQDDPRKAYTAEQMQDARAALRQFLATRAQKVRSTVGCMKDGSDESLAACGGMVLVDETRDRCLEVASRNPSPERDGVRVERCDGGDKQRWQLIAAPGAEGTQTMTVRAVDTGLCLAVGGDHRSGLEQRACGGDDVQRFTRAAGGQSGSVLTSVSDPQRAWRIERAILR